MQATITITRKRYDELIRKELVFNILKEKNDESSYPDKDESRLFKVAIKEALIPTAGVAKTEEDDF